MFSLDVSPVTVQLDLQNLFQLDNLVLTFKVRSSRQTSMDRAFPMWKGQLVFLSTVESDGLIFLLPLHRVLVPVRWWWRGRWITVTHGNLLSTWPPTADRPSLALP